LVTTEKTTTTKKHNSLKVFSLDTETLSPVSSSYSRLWQRFISVLC